MGKSGKPYLIISPLLGVFLLLCLTIPACGGNDDSSEGDISTAGDNDDDADDDDSAPTDDDASDDDSDDDFSNDDDDDACPLPEDEDTYAIPCPDGFRIPEGAAGAGGCITQIFGGEPGYFGHAIQIGPDATRYIAATKGRDIALYSLAADESLDSPWHEEIVAHMGEGVDFVVDDAGVRHLAWRDIWAHQLMYAKDSEECGWLIQVADATPGAGAEPALAIDEDGNAHIASHNIFEFDALFYTTNIAGSWETQFVSGTLGLLEQSTDIAVASDGTVHILYSNDPFEDPKSQHLVSYSDNEWNETWSGPGTSDGQIKAAPDGSLRIATMTGLGVGFYSNASGKWKFQRIQSQSITPALDLDASGNSYIAYYKADGLLRLTTDAGIGWNTQDIYISDSAIAETISTSVDGASNVHVAGYWLYEEGLMYSTNEGGAGSWDHSIVSPGGTIANTSSIALDREGRTHIVFASDQGLMHSIIENGVLTTTTTLDSSQFAYVHPKALQLDSSGVLHLAYGRYDDVLPPRYGTYSSGAWDIHSILEEEEYVDPFFVSFLDADSHLHIGYQTYSEAKYASNVNGWQSEVVDEVDFTEMQSISLNSLGEPVLAYLNDGLWVATRDQGKWMTEIIDPATDDEINTASMEIASNGDIHIAYSGWRSDPSPLKVASNHNGNWTISEVPDSKYARYAFLMLNHDEEPVVFYSKAYTGRPDAQPLYRSTNNDGEWITDIIDQGSPIGIFPSVVIDEHGIQHISAKGQLALSYIVTN